MTRDAGATDREERQRKMSTDAVIDPERKGARQGWRRTAFGVSHLEFYGHRCLNCSHPCTYVHLRDGNGCGPMGDERRVPGTLSIGRPKIAGGTSLPTKEWRGGRRVGCGLKCAVLLVLPSPDKPYPPPRGSIDLVNAQKGGACGCGGQGTGTRDAGRYGRWQGESPGDGQWWGWVSRLLVEAGRWPTWSSW